MSSPVRLYLLLSLAALGLAGCRNYSVVAPAEEPVSIALLPVVNESQLPQVIAPLARNIREGLAHSGNFRLTNEAEAEVQLQVTVLGMSERTMARDPRDTGRPLSYHEEVRVSVEWISELPPPWGPDPELIVTGDQVLYAQPSRVNAQTSAMAGLAERLAERILQSLEWPPTPES